MHERRQIRDAMIAALKGRTVAGEHVSATRLSPQRAALIPAVCVYAIDEVADGVVGNTLRRIVTMAVDAWVQTTAPEGIDDALDDIALEVETALDAQPTLGLDFVFRTLRLESTDFGMKLETDRPQGCVQLKFSVVYQTDPRGPAPTDEFLRGNAKHGAAVESTFNVRGT